MEDDDNDDRHDSIGDGENDDRHAVFVGDDDNEIIVTSEDYVIANE